VAECGWSDGQGTHGGDGVGPNPTDRAKNGTKRSILVDAGGGPLSVVVAGANVHDTKLLQATLEAIVVKRPRVPKGSPQNLCLDKGYDNPTGRASAEQNGYVAHIHRINEERPATKRSKRGRARRWVVERTHAWLSKCRGILVRYEKRAELYLGMMQFACCLLLVQAVRLRHVLR
jgi:putative transposase